MLTSCSEHCPGSSTLSDKSSVFSGCTVVRYVWVVWLQHIEHPSKKHDWKYEPWAEMRTPPYSFLASSMWAHRACQSVPDFKSTHSVPCTYHLREHSYNLCLPLLHSQTQEDQWGLYISGNSSAGLQSGRLVWRRSQKARRLEEAQLHTIAVVSEDKGFNNTVLQIWIQSHLLKHGPKYAPYYLLINT